MTTLALLLFAALPVAARADRFDALTRPIPAGGRMPALTVLNYHDVHDDIRDAGPSDIDAISTDHLIAHFDWLRANGFHVVSLEDVVQAMHGRRRLPDKAVLLTFDDGMLSFYTRVYPLLRAYRYPALFAVENSWMDQRDGESFDYNGEQCGRECFVSWAQVREMQASGLVEIASHTYDLHRGIIANPQGNKLPAAAYLAYDGKHGGYENEQTYRVRVRADFMRSADEIQHETGRRPRAIVWPYGAYSKVAEQEAKAAGMDVSLSLDEKFPVLAPGQTIPRLLIADNISVNGLALMLYQEQTEVAPERVVQVDLDYVYDRDPAQQEKNLSALLDRIQRLKPTQVWLQAYADPDGDGVAKAVYFPNRHLPMRADLFARVSWQLSIRTEVPVYAWMPVLAFRFPNASGLPALGKGGANDKDHFRLAPWDPQVRQMIGDVYEDLAMHAPMDGLLFSDDAYLRDTDNLGPWTALAPVQRTQALIDFTRELAARVRPWRPQIKTARNLYARPVLDSAVEAWFAQSLPAFNAAYDFTALMAMPQLDQQTASDGWFLRLVKAVAAQPNGLNRTLFELAAFDWHSKQPIPAAVLAHQMALLQAHGVRHLGYYPDDFITDTPLLETIRPAISAATYPYPKK